jgi:mRNA-degrading endonuclease RelE of RelBE toxin-antitoxin system
LPEIILPAAVCCATVRLGDFSKLDETAPLAYRQIEMLIVETTVFTRRLFKLLDDETYRLFQYALVADPECGDLIRGSGGLRKVRWAAAGRGKRGGVRIIYYWGKEMETILLLLIYGKNEMDDLSQQELKLLRKLVEEEFK